ncbi:hypothetical protein [Massilia sp. 9I]|uniref:hypothetical protein n=1 Tax=Massilia sp. 9I TaxID=2653152 RepID=UPI0012EF423B|nr:hypothetical protein [Massilia sp. 9I]VXC59870.1 conserved exported hypothetical protein [Massilia sp. 9I]
MKPMIHRTRSGALLVSLALLLGACGGSNDRPHVVEPPPPTGTNPPPAQADSFFMLVASRVAALFDNDEPVAIDSATPTTPENTEPEPLPST